MGSTRCPTRLGLHSESSTRHNDWAEILRDSGTAWAAIIDVSAVLMTLVSLTGMLLIFFLQKKRLSGLLAAAAGIVLCYLAYVVLRSHLRNRNCAIRLNLTVTR